ASSSKSKGILAQVQFLTGRRTDQVHSLQSLESIWASLNQNARKIFQLLVEDFFDNPENMQDRKKTGNLFNGTYDGMEFWDLYRKCRDQFLVTSETALRTQLVEFKDHQILEFKRSPGGLEYLKFKLDRALLREFGAEQGLVQIDEHANEALVDFRIGAENVTD